MSDSKFNSSNILGPLLFGLGVVVAIASSAKMPAEGTSWPDTVLVFVIAALSCALGIFLWRRDLAAARAEGAKEQAGSADSPEALLSGLMEPLSDFVDQIGTMDADGICARVDQLLEKYVLPFAEGRQKVLDSMGMEKGAEILVVMAYGERMLNRTWSAAGDGHLPESRASLPESAEAFREAYALISPTVPGPGVPGVS